MRNISNDDFERKYYLFKDTIYNISYTYVKNRSDADDITQEVFLKYLKSDIIFKTELDEKYWLIRVTINTSKSYITSFWKKNVTIDEENIRIISSIEENSESLFDKVCALPEKYKTVVILFYYENLSIIDISKVLKVSVSAVKKRLERGRNILREKE